MLTSKFHDAAMFIHPERAQAAAQRLAATYDSVRVTRKIRRMMDRFTVEHGYCVAVDTHGLELFLAEA